MELLYFMDDTRDLADIPALREGFEIRWLRIPNDFPAFKAHLRRRDLEDTFTVEKFASCHANGIDYCGLFFDGMLIGRGAVERYSQTHWECADIRVEPAFRDRGNAKRIVWFVMDYILKNGRTATCRTEEHNKGMQRVITALGYRERSIIK